MTDKQIPDQHEEFQLRDGLIVSAAVEWAQARIAFISLGPNHSGAKAALNRLANAEDALSKLAIAKAGGAS